jgi:ribosomal subunit interface protein
VDIVVRGRQVAISDRFREHTSAKLSKLERLDGHVTTIDVEVIQEQNPRLADIAHRVELTCRGKGPVVRAEAAADTKYAALDLAIARLEERLRRAVERRRSHRHQRTSDVVEQLVAVTPGAVGGGELGAGAVVGDRDADNPAGLLDELAEGPMLVKDKVHDATPMTLDDALYEMELVGHDFYLFVDKESRMPSVVYRRRAYDYGVIHLNVDG